LKLETALVSQFTTELSETEAGPHIVLTISDNGCGMDKQIMDQIFDPFYSTKGAQGTGLGLSTVYGIVKQHDGSIQVTSAPDLGTTFRIHLPVSRETLQEHDHSDTSQAESGASETILLVEDDQPVRTLSSTILEKQGYRVLEAETGDEALRVVYEHQGPIDLILTDVVMPGMNGREMCTKVTQQHPDVKVLFMSGYTDDVIVHHGILDQGIHFIQKPFSIQALAGKVREILEGHGSSV
jgi:CheY-like chemotaxis protein